MIYLEIITSILIICAMGYMSAIGTAYLAIDDKKLKLDELKNDSKKLKRLKEIIKTPSVFISSINAGVSFCSLWLGSLVVEIFAMPLYRKLVVGMEDISYIIKYLLVLATIVIISYVIYVIAEIIPKGIAVKKKEKIVFFTVNFVYVFSKIFRPITKFMKATDALIMRILDIDRKEIISYKDSEIKEAALLSQEMGVISKQDGKIITNFIHLDEMTAKDIMVDIEKVEMLDINSSKADIKKKIIDCGYTRIPVYNKDIRNIVGIMNVKNVLKNILIDKKIATDKYVKPCMRVSSGKRLDLLFNEMKNNSEHMAVVVKEKDIAIGIVTMEDIIEQIVGNIEDDFEKYEGVK